MENAKPEIDFTVNSFNKMIKAGIIKKNDHGLWIRMSDILDKKRADGSNWNRRDMTSQSTKEHIERITKHLQRNGKVPPIEVMVVHGQAKVEKVDGYCRYEAYGNVDASGCGDLMVNISAFVGDELDALCRIQTSNEGEKLTPLEQLDLYQSIRAELLAMGEKGSLAQIAERIGKTRQYVDQILNLEKLDDKGRKMLEAGEVSTADAIKAVRTVKALKEADEDTKTKAMTEALNKAAEKRSKDKLPEQPAPPTVARSLLDDMFTIVKSWPAAMSADEAHDVEQFLRGNKGAPRTANYVRVDLEAFGRLTSLVAEGLRQLEVKTAKAASKAQEAAQEAMDIDLD